jgi:outer membrane biosynthesis protein TonB
VLESVAIRSDTGRRVARLRNELLEAESRREMLLRGLGAAVYADDAEATQSLENQLTNLDEGIRAKEAEMQSIVDEAQERISRGRSSVQPTLIEPAQPAPVPEPAPPPDEGTPPQPPEIPEPSPPPDEWTIPTPDPVPETGPDPAPDDSRN